MCNGMTYLFLGIRLHTIMGDARELSGGRRQLKDNSEEAIIHQGSLKEATRIYEGLLLLSQRVSLIPWQASSAKQKKSGS